MAFLNRHNEAGKVSLGRKLLAFVTSISMVMTLVALPAPASADDSSTSDGDATTSATTDLGAPSVSKTVTQPDENGNFQLTLSVTGKSQSSTTQTQANVIFVADVSGSMNEAPYPSYQQDSNGAYGKVGNDYVPLYFDYYGYHLSLVDYGNYYDGTSTLYYRSGYRYSEYTGERYSQKSNQVGSRLDAAKSAINAAAKSVLDQNSQDNVATWIKLITFSTKVVSDSDWSTDYSSFSTAVNNMSAEGGTNWQDALARAQADASGRDGNTYVIFVSDGLPSFRNDAYGASPDDRNDGYNSRYGVWGNGNTDPYNRNFDTANAVASQMAQSGITIYSINAFGEATTMQNLPGDYYAANDQDQLNDALSKIVKQITNARSYKKVKITDTLSGDVVSGTASNGDIDALTVKVTDKDGNDVTSSQKDLPKPTVNGQTITWEFGDTPLQDGYTYSVTADVKLTERAYTDAAALMNGDTATSKNIKKDGNTVKAYSNTDSKNNKVDYTEFTTTNGNPDPGSDKPGSVNFNRPTVNVPVSTLTVSKTWDGDGAKSDVTANIQQDDNKDYKTLTLSQDNDWSSTIYVPGCPKGHTYSVTEASNPSGWVLESYKWGVVDANTQAATGTIKGQQSATATITNKLVTYGFRVLKTNGSGSDATPLQGATFTLTPEGDRVTGEDGIASWSQLTPGTYTIVETHVPTGYQKLDGSHTLVIRQDGTATWDDKPITPSVGKDGTTYFQVKVDNNSVANLPATGSIGVWPLLAGGVALVAAGVAFVIFRRREQ
ncbi:MAG: SpaA isopeptide-forming pilin-related protein [Atopobiaceae bacterium]